MEVSQLETLPVTTDQLRNATHYDPEISKVLHVDYVLIGWPVPEMVQTLYTC